MGAECFGVEGIRDYGLLGISKVFQGFVGSSRCLLVLDIKAWFAVDFLRFSRIFLWFSTVGSRVSRVL